MAEITATLVKELREATNLGMMDCKKALVETAGDKDAAIKLLRERGAAIADKKAARTANEGRIATLVNQGGKVGVIIEVNCETDFVAKNETFQAFVGELAERAKECADGELAGAVKDVLTEKIAELGENLVVRRNARFQAQGPGIVASYTHLGAKVGVLLEVGCEQEETAGQPAFKEVVKDITLHIAACSPSYLTREAVPAQDMAAEREIYAKQVENKPAQIIDKIVTGKLEKYLSQICLVEQSFVKDPDQTVEQLLAARGKALNDTLTIRRFLRYQVGA